MHAKPQKYNSKVISNERLSTSGYLITIERNGMPFEAGQCLTIHGRDMTEDRTYTIASGVKDEHLQVLYRHIPHGKLTPQLVLKKAGDPIQVSGPYGEFMVRDLASPLVFIATGTGVAPCRAYLRSHPGLKISLIHGVRENQDLFCRSEFAAVNYFPCVSKESGIGFKGRTTEFFPSFQLPAGAHYHLCGANEMIFDMHGMLKERGVDDAFIHTEAYYYRLYS